MVAAGTMIQRHPSWVSSLLALAICLLAGVLATPAEAARPAAGASDARRLVSEAQLHRRPFRSVVLVAVGDRVVCTGFVVAPQKVVTAAHCLSRDASRGDFRFRRDLPGEVRLYRGFSQAAGGEVFGSCPVSSIWAHPRFIKGDPDDPSFGSRAHDYAVLTVPVECAYPNSAVIRMWQTDEADDELPAGTSIFLSGYPADGRFEGMNGLNLWRSQGEVRPPDGDPRLIDTTGFVAQGMSGGPVWSSFGLDSPCGRAQCVVGILTECAVNGRGQCRLGDSLRRAIRITPSVKAAIQRR
jgi:V8-like Glu-specific endopeptidase